MRFSLLTGVLCLLAASSAAFAGGHGRYACGYANNCCAPQVVVVCRGHCKHHGHCWAAAPPVGPVVSSVAAPQFATLSTVGLVASPLVSFAPQYAVAPQVAVAPQSAPQETSCQASSSRINALEERINLLQGRMDQLQFNQQQQTEILKEIAERVKD